ncbi:hypothetical protein B7P43_G01210 [Cryptotermes secundus]|uniref:Uncharacterized protein n=1 Tax=Cryptotermes secundus TaxID=105785 RepID=A0A2J7RCW1_9NEOP|nr:hypothetical protein B7P43_G01210 [Cryptotermes secundus]
MDMKFNRWNGRNLYIHRAGSLMAVAKEISKHKLNLGGVQEIRWTGVALDQLKNVSFSMERRMKIVAYELVEEGGGLNDKMYTILRGCWCSIIVLNVDCFYEELDRVFDKFVIKFATSKNLIVKRTMFPRRNIHKFTLTPPDGKTYNQISYILIEWRRYSSILDI